MPSNVPDDWGQYYTSCNRCGATYHMSEGDCSCPPLCIECGDVSDEECEHDDMPYCTACYVQLYRSCNDCGLESNVLIQTGEDAAGGPWVSCPTCAKIEMGWRR